MNIITVWGGSTLYLDNPSELRKALPGMVPLGAAAHYPPRADFFREILLQNLPIPDPTYLPGWGKSAGGVVPFWSEFFLTAQGKGSQYDALRETLAACGPPDANLACLALGGTGFHGQHGRRWQVLPGNLHLSALVVCDLPAAEFAPVLPALPAVAVAEAITALGGGGLAPGIKWVNDVMLQEKKVAGSLTALRTVEGRITAVVVGVGLNVRQAPDLGGGAGLWPATALADETTGPCPTLEATLVAVLNSLAASFTRLSAAGPASLLAAYRGLSILIGRRITVWPDAADAGDAKGPVATGEVLAVGPDLSLRLAGYDRPVTAGRVTWAAPGT